MCTPAEYPHPIPAARKRDPLSPQPMSKPLHTETLLGTGSHQPTGPEKLKEPPRFGTLLGQ